ncbi:MAG: hypothetical protein KAU50_01465, partial [Candidatus Marinimicrobia bacterium]|nr:hypothetical protein [Candidatus Neomarinimicrobiota bacterium]
MLNQDKRRRNMQQRDDLTGEYALGDLGQILFASMFTVIWIADTFFFKFTTFLDQYMAFWVKIPSGVVLLILSGYLARTGLATVYGKEREKPGVIRESVFNVVRHPVYLSEILLYL